MKSRVACQRASFIVPMPWLAASPPVTSWYCLSVDTPHASSSSLMLGLSRLISALPAAGLAR
ncbi:hypothetical protein D3C81_1242620 [compost metagenome]